MAKKFKKKIEDMCGLTSLDWKARQAKAIEILDNTEWKQQLCNDLQGLSFKDLERVLKSIANERQIKETEDDDRKTLRNDKGSNSKFVRRPAAVPVSAARSIEQILAQVYAPKVLPEFRDLDHESESGRFKSFSHTHTEVLQHPDDDDGETIE